MDVRKSEQIQYLVASDFDKSWGLFSTTIGFQKTLPNSSYPPEGHPSRYGFKPETGRVLNEYQIIYIVAGQGTFQSSSCKPCKVHAGSVIFLFPGEWHTFIPLKKTGWQVYWLGFDGKHVDDFLSGIFFTKQSAVFDVGFNEQIVSLYEQGIEVANLQRAAYQQMLAGITHHLLSILCYARKNGLFKDKETAQQIDRARMIMTANVYSKKNPEEIADELNLSYSWFRKLFKQYTGFSPAQYQMEIKLQKSKELLTSTVMPVKTIAYELNFESISYFVTFFKTKTGISPGAYRQRVHAKTQQDDINKLESPE